MIFSRPSALSGLDHPLAASHSEPDGVFDTFVVHDLPLLAIPARDLIHERNNAALQGRPHAHDALVSRRPSKEVTKSSI